MEFDGITGYYIVFDGIQLYSIELHSIQLSCRLLHGIHPMVFSRILWYSLVLVCDGILSSFHL